MLENTNQARVDVDIFAYDTDAEIEVKQLPCKEVDYSIRFGWRSGTAYINKDQATSLRDQLDRLLGGKQGEESDSRNVG